MKDIIRRVIMSKEYKPVRARLYPGDKDIGMDGGDLYIKPQEGGEVRVTNESQLDRLEKRILLLEDEIKYLHELLSFKVNQDQVINAINISAKDDRINGNKIHVTGETLIEDGVLLRKDSSIKLDKEKMLAALDSIDPYSARQ